MIDGRLKGTKCAECFEGHYLVLEEIQYTPCADCKDRPNRNKDVSRFSPDVKNEWTKDFLDQDAKIDSKFDY